MQTVLRFCDVDGDKDVGLGGYDLMIRRLGEVVSEAIVDRKEGRRDRILSMPSAAALNI